MEVQLTGTQMLKLRRIADETGDSIEGIAQTAVQAFLNRIHDADLQPLGEKEQAANALGNMLINARNKRLGRVAK